MRVWFCDRIGEPPISHLDMIHRELLAPLITSLSRQIAVVLPLTLFVPCKLHAATRALVIYKVPQLFQPPHSLAKC